MKFYARELELKVEIYFIDNKYIFGADVLI